MSYIDSSRSLPEGALSGVSMGFQVTGGDVCRLDVSFFLPPATRERLGLFRELQTCRLTCIRLFIEHGVSCSFEEHERERERAREGRER